MLILLPISVLYILTCIYIHMILKKIFFVLAYLLFYAYEDQYLVDFYAEEM